MAGFPIRHLLQSFGSKLRDARPVENPEIQVSAGRLNLSESIAAASSLLLPRVGLIAQWNTTTSLFEVYHQEEAWNARHEQARPTLARASAGSYTYTFAESYLDADGVAIPSNIVAARVFVMDTNPDPLSVSNPLASVRVDNSTVHPIIYISITDGGYVADARFWLEVF